MRQDLEKVLCGANTKLEHLCPLERVLLTTDGTLTDILEAYLLEPIRLVKLSEESRSLTEGLASLGLEPGSRVVDRKILLQGTRSERNYVHAESVIALDRLEDSFRDDLLTSKMPLGRLWLTHKLETFKEIVAFGEQPPDSDLSLYFGLRAEERVLMRTYRVISNRQPLMLITERIPRGIYC
jgi:chorismate-pyruvate lyase